MHLIEGIGIKMLENIFKNIGNNEDPSKSRYTYNAHTMHYNSPLERDFTVEIEKCLREDTYLMSNYEIYTMFKSYYLDLFLRYDKYAIGIEIDGKKYHRNIELGYDTFIRETLLLGSKKIFGIFRFDGHNTNFNMHDCMFAIYSYFPHFFSDRGKNILERMSNEGTINTEFEKYNDDCMIIISNEYERKDRLFSFTFKSFIRNKTMVTEHKALWYLIWLKELDNYEKIRRYVEDNKPEIIDFTYHINQLSKEEIKELDLRVENIQKNYTH